MRLSLRFLIPLLLALGVFAYAAVPLVDSLMTRWFVRDLDIRAQLIASTVQEPLAQMIESGSPGRIARYFTRLTQDERIYAVGLCLPETHATDRDAGLSRGARLRSSSPSFTRSDTPQLLRTPRGPLHVAVRTLDVPAAPGAELVLVHDMSFVVGRSEETKRYLFYFFVALGAIVALITVVIAQLSWRGWVQGLRALLRGEGLVRPRERRRRAGAAPDRARRARARARARSASTARATSRSSRGRRKRCARSCAASCAATT